MREILFRGKKCDEWFEGCLLYDEENNKAFIAEYFEDESAYLREVIPETIGQYTGVTDRKGKKIFEGDIVYEYNVLGKRSDKKYVVTWEDIFVRWSIAECHGMYGSEHIAFYEIIGNVHDNPELLKGDLI